MINVIISLIPFASRSARKFGIFLTRFLLIFLRVGSGVGWVIFLIYRQVRIYPQVKFLSNILKELILAMAVMDSEVMLNHIIGKVIIRLLDDKELCAEILIMQAELFMLRNTLYALKHLQILMLSGLFIFCQH